MPTVSSLSIQSFLDYCKFEKRYSIHTITSYQTDLAECMDYLSIQFGVVSLKEVNHSFVRSWLASLKEKGLTAKSINRKISSLKSFFKYHLRTGSIEATPMGKVISPKIAKRLPVFIKEEDTARLIQSATRATEDWKSLNTRMLITIFYATGMRLSELINLREKQVDFSKSQIKVLGKGNKERIIPVSSEVADMIKQYQQLKKKEFVRQGSFGEKTDNRLLVTEKVNFLGNTCSSGNSNEVPLP